MKGKCDYQIQPGNPTTDDQAKPSKIGWTVALQWLRGSVYGIWRILSNTVRYLLLYIHGNPLIYHPKTNYIILPYQCEKSNTVIR